MYWRLKPRPDQPPPSTLGKRGLEDEPQSTAESSETIKKSKGEETDDKAESSGS
jgi:hypothetical protein